MNGVKDPNANSRVQLLDTLWCIYVTEYDAVMLKMSVTPFGYAE